MQLTLVEEVVEPVLGADEAVRKAYMFDPALDSGDWEDVASQMCTLGKVNGMKIHGKFDGKYWETTGFEFPDKQSLTMFLLKWT